MPLVLALVLLLVMVAAWSFAQRRSLPRVLLGVGATLVLLWLILVLMGLLPSPVPLGEL